MRIQSPRDQRKRLITNLTNAIKLVQGCDSFELQAIYDELSFSLQAVKKYKT
ncbi:MAG: hypothetical protein LBS76_05005 [Mycoplasmataceae bacterium]|nr:hypothetical protein [Mycoplasmataceae bacterium]